MEKTQGLEIGGQLLLVNTKVLPDIFEKVVEAKRLLAVGKVKNYSEAAKAVGISRSALYKYKDYIFIYNQEIDQSVITLHAYLEDRPGVLSSLINELSRSGANILTVNQNIPVDGVASVSVSARLTGSISASGLVSQIKFLDGVVELKVLSAR